MNEGQIKPRFPRTAFIVQLIYGACLFLFSLTQYGGHFDIIAVFCITLPLVLIYFSVAGLCGERRALIPSIIAHAFIFFAAALICFPEILDLAGGVDSWFGPLILIVSAPILILSSVLAISLHRYRANSQSTGNA